MEWPNSVTKVSHKNFLECNGKMGVPISFFAKANKEATGNFYNRFFITTKNAIYSIRTPSGEIHYYEILDYISSPKINGSQKYKRVVIWEVFKHGSDDGAK